jgi:hypothetical protein
MTSLLHSTVNLKLQFTISLSLFPTHGGISYNTPTKFLPPFQITSSTNESYLCHCSHFVEMIIIVTPLLLWESGKTEEASCILVALLLHKQMHTNANVAVHGRNKVD